MDGDRPPPATTPPAQTPPPPPPSQARRLNPIRDNPYWIVGILLIVANIIPGLVAYALVASIIGERFLEGDDGGATWLGSILLYLPPLIGLTLVLFGRPISRTVLSPRRPLVPLTLAAVGVIGTALGAVGIGDTSGGANIGAGLLLLFCPPLTVVSVIWSIWVFRNKRQ